MSKHPKTESEIPDSWYPMFDANEQPRRIGDAYWHHELSQWIVFCDNVKTKTANMNNWAAIRHQFAPIETEGTESVEVLAAFRLPIPVSKLGQLGGLLESIHRPNELFIRQTGPYLEFVRNRETG
jgi:hypothetical protein